MAEYTVTVLTATYNRRNNLPSLFESLRDQTKKDFQWLIIDDGSLDDTEEYVRGLSIQGVCIDYYKKPNGGKHTALNYSHRYIKGDLVFMVDSDDYLVEDAIEIIEKEWMIYKNNRNIGVFSYRKKTKSGIILSETVVEPFIENDISYRINNNIVGDRSEVIRTELFTRFPLPEFEGERFMGEGWLFRQIAYEYQTIYYNKVIYVCEYMEDGLSNSGRLLRMNCPFGMMENCKSFFVPMVNRKEQIKQTLAYGVYGICAGLTAKEIAESSGRKYSMYAMLPASYALYTLWKYRYGFERVGD